MSERPRFAIAASPGFILGVGALLANDHILKSAFPGVITGKLSDVAGLFVAGYVLNRRWTFASRADPVTQLPRYLVAQLAGLALSAAIMAFAVHVQRWSPYVGLVLGIVLVPPVTFALARAWVFRDSRRP